MGKQKTIDTLKENRKVPESVKARVKAFTSVKNKIKQSLKPESKTIPQIAEDTGLEVSLVTHTLMSMMKYGEIAVDKVDDDDEYYFYKLK